MFNVNKSDLQRIAVSSVGALAITTACFVGVAGPARATPLSGDAWQGAVEKQVDSQMDHFAMKVATPTDAVVAVRFTADGDYAGAALARSTGNAALDAHALDVARAVSYPALPAGKARTVAMVLTFGVSDGIESVKPATRRAANVQLADAQGGAGSIKIAAK